MAKSHQLNNLSKQKCNQCTNLDYSIRSTSTIINSGGKTLNWSIYQFYINRIKSGSITPEKRIPRRKGNIKSLAASPPRKDQIPNQNKKTFGIQKYQCPPPHEPTFPSGFKSLRNEASYDDTETIDTSRTDKDDTSRTNGDDYIQNVKSVENTNDYDKYK